MESTNAGYGVDAGIEELHVETPLVYSGPLSNTANRPVYIKLENTQPSGSFKLRGIGHTCRHAVKNGATHLVCSSGGNAGLATAYSAHRLGVKATVFTMDGLPQPVLKKFSDLKCDIFVGGPVWDICDRTARKYMAKLQDKGEKTCYIHPFDGQMLWDGHATMVHEMARQLGGATPGAVVTCVGGGGLLAGIARGLTAVSWDDVPIIAMETHGADSYNQALAAGHLISLPAITSVAKTLGALRVCQEILDIAGRRQVISRLTDDKTAVECASRFLRDHQMLVEPACGATLSVVYKGKLGEYLGARDDGKSPIVVIICGGATVDKATLDQLVADLGVETALDRHYPIEQMRL